MWALRRSTRTLRASLVAFVKLDVDISHYLINCNTQLGIVRLLHVNLLTVSDKNKFTLVVKIALSRHGNK